MTGIDLVEKLAELQRQYANAHRPIRSIEAYRARQARHHPERDYDGERHICAVSAAATGRRLPITPPADHSSGPDCGRTRRGSGR
jgi:hypothetical protein